MVQGMEACLPFLRLRISGIEELFFESPLVSLLDSCSKWRTWTFETAQLKQLETSLLAEEVGGRNF